MACPRCLRGAGRQLLRPARASPNTEAIAAVGKPAYRRGDGAQGKERTERAESGDMAHLAKRNEMPGCVGA